MRTHLTSRCALLAVFSASFALTGFASAQTPNNVDQTSLVTDFSADALLNNSSIPAWSPSAGSSGEAATVVSADTSVGGPYISDPTVSASDAAFNGHQYVNFYSVPGQSTQGLATASNLGLTGAGDMSIASVYVDPVTPYVSASAGLANANPTTTSAVWFDLQTRTSGVNGDPYLAGFNNDLNSNVPAQNQNGLLTFALATYTINGGSAVYDLYWAFGLTGAVQHAQQTLSLANTAGDQFELGYSPGDALAGNGSGIELGQAIAYNSALSGADATQEIQNLQSFYGTVPEPSTYAMLCFGIGGLAFCARRKLA